MTGAHVLTTQNLTRTFGGVRAVENVSLTLKGGGIHCIIGPNGAGKSTVLNMICGTLSPSSGSIIYEGRDIASLSRRQIAKLGIARKFQVPSVFASLTVLENLEVAAQGPAGADKTIDVADILRRVELSHLADMDAAHLAHGQKQWLEIGMALATGPSLLLLDEPTAGMTTGETARTAALIRALAGEVTVLVIEHDISFVRALDGETIAMHQGRVIAEGPFEAVAADPTVRDVYLGRG